MLLLLLFKQLNLERNLEEMKFDKDFKVQC